MSVAPDQVLAPAVIREERGRMLVLIVVCGCCLAILSGLAVSHALRVSDHAGDDESWRAHAAGGLAGVWTDPSPFSHYRPVFGTWLVVLQRLGASTPTGLALAALVLYMAGGALAYWAFRPMMDPPCALLTAVLVSIHPARQQQLFWTSAGIDALAMLVSLVAIGLAVRAYRRDAVSTATFVAIGLTTALAVLSKEIALALPLILVLLPGSAPLARRLSVGSASLVGAALAAFAWLAVIRGGGRPAGLLSIAGSPVAALYPTRLFWPGDLQDWTFHAKLGGGFAPLLGVAAISAVAIAVLAWAWWGKLSHPIARSGLLLVGAGLLPWLIRQDDRSIGLGVVGLALLIAGAAYRKIGAFSWVGPTVLLVLALSWFPIWIRWEARWLEASRLSGEVVDSWRDWRAAAGPDELLVAIGTPSMVGWTCEVAGVEDVDPCGLGLFAVLGPSPAPPVQMSIDADSGLVQVSTTGGTILRSSRQPAPLVGVMSIETDDAGYVRGGVLDLRPLQQAATRRGCAGVDVRWWDGTEFVPSSVHPIETSTTTVK